MFKGEQSWTEPITQNKLELQYSRPLKVGDPLMKVREKQIAQINQKLKQNDFLVLGTVARSGASSVLENLNMQNPETKVVSLNAIDPKFIWDIDEVMGYQEEEGCLNEVIVVINEANVIWFDDGKIKNIDDDETPSPNLYDVKEILNEANKFNIKVVFQSHDFYGTDGKGGMNGMKKWLQDNIFDEQDVKMDSLQLETVDDVGLAQIFDIISEKMVLPQDLINAKDEVVSLCTVPQQLNLIILGYIKARKEGGVNHQEVLKDALRSSHLLDELLGDMIRTTAQEKMGKLLKKASDSENGIEISQLSEDERDVIERYKNFHFFNIDGDIVKVNGKLLVEYVQKNY
jgi:hypothetical protein